MYSALLHQFGGRQKKMETVLLPQLLVVKKNHKSQTAANWLNYVNYSPKKIQVIFIDPESYQNTHFLKKEKKNNETLLFSNLKAANNSFNGGMLINGF